MLAWNVQNLIVDTSGPSVRFRKADAGLSGQGALKIDGIMAALSAITLLSTVTATDVTAMIG